MDTSDYFELKFFLYLELIISKFQSLPGSFTKHIVVNQIVIFKSKEAQLMGITL